MNIEEFVNDYLQEHRHDVLLNPYNGLIEFAEAFKEEMLKDAVDAKIYGYDDGSYELIASWLDLPKGIYKDGDKVRIIVIRNTDEK